MTYRFLTVSFLLVLTAAASQSLALPTAFYFVTSTSGPWLLNGLAESGGSTWWWILIHLHDSAAVILLSLPIAFLLIKLSRTHLWPVVSAAVLLSFLWDYRLPLSEMDVEFFTIPTAAWGALSHLIVLPIAVLILAWERRHFGAGV